MEWFTNRFNSFFFISLGGLSKNGKEPKFVNKYYES
jgi:hypothetical protein